MARAENAEIIDRFEEFYRNYYRNEIGELAQKYPNEQKSLFVDFDDVYRFDPDVADDFVAQPGQMQDYAEEALRLYDLPVDVKLGQAHVRVRNLPDPTGIREIRADHVGNLIAVQGIVRKATDVRPKIQNAAFECQRCGTMTRVPQSDGSFQEPHECQGCERQGPFQINFDQSEFLDSQKIRVQESPEGLRGGETPQAIDVHIEDDITGEVTAGDHVTVTGILRLEQQGTQQEKSPVFDFYMQGTCVEVEDEQFEEMDITEADKKEIVELSNDPEIYEKMVASMAPSIWGYEEEKMAIIMQLFSGVKKNLPDGSRIRGDLHMLLIGDPGTGKCVRGDTKVTLADGTERPIRELVEENLDDPSPIDDGVYDEVDIPLPSMEPHGTIRERRATKVWKREAPDVMYRINTASGRSIEVTPSHPLFVQSGGRPHAARAENLSESDFVATPRTIPTAGDDTLDVEFRRSASNNAVRLNLPDEWTPWLARLVGYIVAEGHVVLRENNTGDVRITNDDEEILSDVALAFDELGLNYTTDGPRDGKSAKRIRCSSSELVSFLQELEPAILERSAEQRVPEPILGARAGTKREFLRAYVDGEGHVSVKEREITVASMSRDLLEGVRSLLLSLEIPTTIESRKNGSYRLRISGDSFRRYVETVGFVTEWKSIASQAFDDLPNNTNVDVVPDAGEELREVREALALSQFDCGIPRTTYQHYERGDRAPSRTSLRRVVETFEDRLEELRKTKDRVRDGDWRHVEAVREDLNISQKALAEPMDVEQATVSYYERTSAIPDGGSTAAATDTVVARIDDGLAVKDRVEALRQVAESDVYWDKIESIETVEPHYDWVYDLEVKGTHTYLSNNVISHNSQLLQYVKKLAPRSVYTSGKGSSSAGLTAAAVRDDFGDGQQWTLEAGALVLADQGIAAIDELDKMRCVTGDTLVHLGDRVTRIRELADEAAQTGSIEELSNGRTIRDVDAEAWTMTDDGRLVTRPVTAIHEYDAPAELTQVTLESGEELTSTPDHPYFVFEEDERMEKPAASLDRGDRVYVPSEDWHVAADGGTTVETPIESIPEEPDVTLRRVEHVEQVPASPDSKVYDLTVDGTHNFVANWMIVHNSEDRSAMHEALEQQSISISKAGINATLKSRCSLLGAANPKYGRFDQYEPVGEQIDLEPALISRFDLIFTVTDQPDEEKDGKLADHIIKTNYAGELFTHRQNVATSNVSREEVDNVSEDVEPVIEGDLLRKYVAYAKRNCFPTMTEEAKEVIRDFYVDLRARGADEDAPVPVTARKLEALVRLSEASARVRLSDTVEREDAEKVIEIVRNSLRDIGVDPETGEFDADIVEAGRSKTQRDRIKNIRGIIRELEGEYEDGAPEEEVFERAEAAGMDRSKAEHEIEKLRQKGEIYEPTQGHLRTT